MSAAIELQFDHDRASPADSLVTLRGLCDLWAAEMCSASLGADLAVQAIARAATPEASRAACVALHREQCRLEAAAGELRETESRLAVARITGEQGDRK